jgi:hypothetical protein
MLSPAKKVMPLGEKQEEAFFILSILALFMFFVGFFKETSALTLKNSVLNLIVWMVILLEEEHLRADFDPYLHLFSEKGQRSQVTRAGRRVLATGIIMVLIHFVAILFLMV